MANELNVYAQYLVATQIRERLEKVGLVMQYVMLATDYDNRGPSGLEVAASISYDDANGKYLLDKDREARLNELLELFPEVSVTREGAYGAPDMIAHWVSSHGIVAVVNFHSGVCERKQVGTKKVTTYDPEALAAVGEVNEWDGHGRADQLDNTRRILRAALDKEGQD